jgi:hypothetical protein
MWSRAQRKWNSIVLYQMALGLGLNQLKDKIVSSFREAVNQGHKPTRADIEDCFDDTFAESYHWNDVENSGMMRFLVDYCIFNVDLFDIEDLQGSLPQFYELFQVRESAGHTVPGDDCLYHCHELSEYCSV